jgi:hypothetical protein
LPVSIPTISRATYEHWRVEAKDVRVVVKDLRIGVLRAVQTPGIEDHALETTEANIRIVLLYYTRSVNVGLG